MTPRRSDKRIELDRAKLLGFDQRAASSPQPLLAAIGAKVGGKTGAPAAMIGGKFIVPAAMIGNKEVRVSL
ncbi:MAG TPA: hypothetical protein VGL58_14000 [Caulobacteraceae bacterium]|jgi:hypothetical protein